MALKDLLVYADQTEGATQRLRLAADLARRHDARLTVLFVRAWTEAQLRDRKTAEFGLVDAAQLERLNKSVSMVIDRAAERLQSLLADLQRTRGLQAEWRSLEGLPAVLVPQHARYADICILGHDVPIDRAAVDYSFCEEVLFATGRPVLFVPIGGSFTTLGRHVAVAWNGSRAAAHALSGALPLIEQAEHTTVITANPAGLLDRQGAVPLERMVEHLRRHGAAVTAVQIENVAKPAIADALQTTALQLGADLLVAGAFGQASLREKLLGGVTHQFLARMQLPLLMSH